MVLVSALGSLVLLLALAMYRHQHPVNLYLLLTFVSLCCFQSVKQLIVLSRWLNVWEHKPVGECNITTINPTLSSTVIHHSSPYLPVVMCDAAQ